MAPELKSGGCLACHQMGNKATREIPPALGQVRVLRRSMGAAHPVRPGGGGMSNSLNQLGRSARSRCSPTGPTASPPARCRHRAAASAGHRAQRRHHAVGLGRPKGVSPRRGLDRPAQPTVNANGPLYGALELSADYLPVLDPVRHTASRVPLTVRDPEHAADESSDAAAVAVLGRRSRSGRARTTCTTRCSTSAAACGSPPPCVRRTTRRSARRARSIRRRSSSRSRAPAVTSPCTIRRRRSSRTSARASARTISCSPRMRTTRCGRAAAARWSAG